MNYLRLVLTEVPFVLINFNYGNTNSLCGLFCIAIGFKDGRV